MAPERSAAVVFEAGTAAGAVQVVKRAKSLNIGWVFVTLDTAANPWDTLPGASYWSAVRAQVADSAAQPLPTALTAAGAVNDSGYLVVDMGHSFILPSLNHKWRRIFIDTDDDPLTGYPMDGLGADYLLEEQWIYAWNSATNSWTWLGSLAPEVNTVTAARWRIDRRRLNDVTGPVSLKIELDEADNYPARRRYSPLIDLSADSLPALPCIATNDAVNIQYSLTLPGSYSYRHVFIDTDQDLASGYAFGGVGADYLIENGHLYKHNGSGWSWSWTAWIGMTCSGDTCAWSVSRAALGETQATGEASDLVFHASGSSPTYYGPAFTHQFSD